MFNKILVGIDGSPHGTKALETAIHLAEQFKADLQVFHAIKHHFHLPLFPLYPNMAFQMASGVDLNDETLQALYEAAGKQIIEAAQQHVEEMGVTLEGALDFHLETDLPPSEYAEMAAREMGFDLIVLGCVGHHSGPKVALLGTIASKILNNAPCQVLIVR
ncbi:MAG TPA: universal stress protein [Candidatus Lokiarchaeia archaeon]|nr:universal stress protein [Candidatus Lokiarchaeia archaeon]